MTKYKKSVVHERQNKIARFMRLDQLLRTLEGKTLNEMMNDGQMDDISKRLLQENLKEIEEKYGAEYEPNLFRGRERLWRYRDTNFSIIQQTSSDMEIIRKSIEKLHLFSGDPRYDMLRFYLMGLEKGMSELNVNMISFDHNHEAAGLQHIEGILDAITHQYPLKMCYKPFEREAQEINIHPYHLRQYNNRWFVFGYVEGKNEVMNYALDRIVRMEHLSKAFIATDIDFDEYFDEIVGVSNYKDSNVEKVLLKIDNKSINYIRTKPIHWTQTELKEFNSTTYTIVQLKLKINTELKMLLFSYSDAIEVLEPAWLRDTFAKRIKKMNEIYKV